MTDRRILKPHQLRGIEQELERESMSTNAYRQVRRLLDHIEATAPMEIRTEGKAGAGHTGALRPKRGIVIEDGTSKEHIKSDGGEKK